MTGAIVVDDLVKEYEGSAVVDHVSFRVERGEIFGFLGPNGAGKSTTIKMLCTLVQPSSGRAEVNGFGVSEQRDDVRRSIGLVFQEPTLDTYLTARQNLRFHAELYGVPRKLVGERIDAALAVVGLQDKAKSKVATFSGGMKRRLEIARGFLHAPQVLFLDEPTVGLDPQTRASIWTHIEELRAREDISIFLTTHYMDEAEHCDRIAIIDHGKIVALDTPEALKASVGRDRVEFVADDNAAAVELLNQRLGVDATEAGGSVVLLVAEGEKFVPRLFADLGLTIRSVSVHRPSLDDVFMSFTGRTIRDTTERSPSLPMGLRR